MKKLGYVLLGLIIAPTWMFLFMCMIKFILSVI